MNRYSPRAGLMIVLCSLLGCATLPAAQPERALYVDLRKIVQLNEDSGWIADEARMLANVEPALRSVCQVPPPARAGLDAWLAAQIAAHGGSARALYEANRHDLSAVSDLLALERTLALLRYAEQRAARECPFWLRPDPTFDGVQTDAGRWVLLAETIGFASYILDTHVPAIIAGGRLFAARGVGSALTLGLGPELAAGGNFIPSGSGQGLDATFTAALPVLVRVTRFSRIFDLDLAPVLRVTGGHTSLPPGVRLQLGIGFASLRATSLLSYSMLYAGYEFHPRTRDAKADHTVQIGTRFSYDWAP